MWTESDLYSLTISDIDGRYCSLARPYISMTMSTALKDSTWRDAWGIIVWSGSV